MILTSSGCSIFKHRKKYTKNHRNTGSHLKLNKDLFWIIKTVFVCLCSNGELRLEPCPISSLLPTRQGASRVRCIRTGFRHATEGSQVLECNCLPWKHAEGSLAWVCSRVAGSLRQLPPVGQGSPGTLPSRRVACSRPSHGSLLWVDTSGSLVLARVPGSFQAPSCY